LSRPAAEHRGRPAAGDFRIRLDILQGAGAGSTNATTGTGNHDNLVVKG
ncbi:MAG: hypothetical protein HC792_02765, partial [Acaryochloridaceae cyanobacterium CSU_5_19]|nr:hypothetical protein [Acaryochloridaceae cyanobacterium CSU_5_19]